MVWGRIEPAKAAGNHTSKSVAPRLWTGEEDARLLGLVRELGPDWEVFAIYYQCQDPAEIQARYANLTRKLVYPTWQPEDVFQLRTAIAQYGTEAWEVVAKQVGRQKLTVKECYDYWYHHLEGSEPPGQWPMSQDVMLLLCTYDGYRHILKRMPTYSNLCNHYRTREPATLINRRDSLSGTLLPMPAAAYTAFGHYFWHTVASVLATTNGKVYHPKHCQRRLQWLETALKFTLSLPPPTARKFFELTKTRKRVSLDDTEAIGLEVNQGQLSMLVRTVGLTHYFSRMVLKAGRDSS
ncbi:Myb- protein A [Tieghemiomyces parasiticus]|uniref:Myb- protein A n=1 Tax=Tieghemiomyces parasiticus TaxID=78921 RepID=A0A9W8DZM4_9FUNG|nr:Myb- protein A [Tieghemiomyces parasiticus]